MFTRIAKVAIVLSITVLSACSAMVGQVTHKSNATSSVIDFLYPKGQPATPLQETIPNLQLPLRVGIAFVPSKSSGRDGFHQIDEAALLEKVKQNFIGYDYIERIEVIPSQYLKQAKGFGSLDQISRLYGIDVMALVSYDQVNQSQENSAALSYLTIVGMYVIPGNSNSVQTFVDTAVFDVRSRALLFRAPGTSAVEGKTTAVNVTKNFKLQSKQGFDEAFIDMNTNLKQQMMGFKERVKTEKIAKVENRQGYSGGSSFGWGLFVLLVLLGLRNAFSKAKH